MLLLQQRESCYVHHCTEMLRVCSLLIQVCIQGTGRELPDSVSLLNPIIGEIRSDSVHKMSAFSTSHLLGEGKHSQKN